MWRRNGHSSGCCSWTHSVKMPSSNLIELNSYNLRSESRVLAAYLLTMRSSWCPFSALTLLVGWQEGQTCMWPSWCRCHTLSLDSVKSRLFLPFWYQLAWVVPEKRPLNGCVCVCVCVWGLVDALSNVHSGIVVRVLVLESEFKAHTATHLMCGSKNEKRQQCECMLSAMTGPACQD